MREGRERVDSPGTEDGRHATGTGRLDENAAAALDGGDGGDDLHRLDIRSPAPARHRGDGRPSLMLRAIRGSEEEE